MELQLQWRDSALGCSKFLTKIVLSFFGTTALQYQAGAVDSRQKFQFVRVTSSKLRLQRRFHFIAIAANGVDGEVLNIGIFVPGHRECLQVIPANFVVLKGDVGAVTRDHGALSSEACHRHIVNEGLRIVFESPSAFGPGDCFGAENK